MIYDAAIIGGGFKGMMAAYGLMQQGKRVTIIDKGDMLGGFMAPMRWKGVDIDKGPQYLDGVGETHKKILDDIMQGYEPLTSLNYSYATYWNGTYTEGFALPDYRTLPKTERATVLYETISQNDAPEGAETIADLYDDSNQTCFSYIDAWCSKFLQNDASDLSAINRSFVTFFGRKLVLDNDLSLELKKLPALDDVIAANKKTIDHGTHNLYPLGKNLGYFREAFESRLGAMGANILTGTGVEKIEPGDGALSIELDDGESIQATDIYCTATIDSTEKMLLGTDTISAYVSPVAQVFYLFEVDCEQELPFYIMNYNDSSISRLTNFAAYGNPSESGHKIFCAELPTKIGSELWEDPEAQLDTLSREIEEMGVQFDTVHSSQPFKIPGTYRAVLRGYESQLESIERDIAERYGDSVHVLTPHLLTRASIMNDLSANGILNA